MTTLLTPMNRFRFIRSIKNNSDALDAEKLLNLFSFTSEQLDDLRELHRYATTLHRLDENACNGWPATKTEFRDGKIFSYSVEDEDWRLRDEKKEASIHKKIQAIATKNGWNIDHQGDPRGWPLKLFINGIDASILANYR